MSLSLSQTYTAIGPGLTASFLAAGGTPAYVYSVVPGGAGGTINSGTGLYTAPSTVNENPSLLYDTIRVTDSTTAHVDSQILVGSPLLLFCEVIQDQMNLDNNHCYLWDQKIPQPTDSSLYIAISVMTCKPFSNIIQYDGSGDDLIGTQVVNMHAILDIDIISRGPAARDRKEEVIMAFNSVYAQQQQEKNSFYIGKLPPGSQFINLSHVDGAAIPYRYKISIAMQYVVKKIVSEPFFDTFELDNPVIDSP